MSAALPVPSDDVAEIVAHRDAAVAAYERFFDAIDAAHEHLRTAQRHVNEVTGHGKFSWPSAGDYHREVAAFMHAVKPPRVEEFKATARRLTDVQVWSAIVARGRLESIMDEQATSELRAQMAYVHEQVDPHTGALINEAEIARSLPPVTEDAVFATLEQLAKDAAHIWRRGIARAFAALNRRFRSHDGFKIGHRIILDGALDRTGGWSISRSHRARIFDVERVFRTMDGHDPAALYGGIVGVIEEDRRNTYGPHQTVHEGDYFRARVWENGNVHLWITRKDLLGKVNGVLAEYYGEGLGWGRDEDGSAGEPTPDTSASGVRHGPQSTSLKRRFQAFFTPAAIAERVIREARLGGREPMDILEPSAGEGALASRAARTDRGTPHRVTVVEVQPDLAADLQRSGLYTRCLVRDFLAMPAEARFDRVVMNPPFHRLTDVDHVNHALNFLRPGGRLVAIMSAGSEFSTAKKARDFAARLKRLGGRSFDLPVGAFSEAGTNVSTRLVTVNMSRQK